MNDPLALPSPDPAEPPPAPPPPDRRNLVPWVYGLGFVVLVLALLWIWQNPTLPPSAVRPQQVDAVEQQIQALDARMTQLAARPAPAVPALAPLEQRIAALESRRPAAPDLAPLEQQIVALKAQVAAIPASAGAAEDLAPLEKQVSGLERQVQDLSSLGAQLDTLRQQLVAQQTDFGRRVTQLAADQQQFASRIKSQDSSVAARLRAVQQQASAAAAVAEKDGAAGSGAGRARRVGRGTPDRYAVTGLRPALARFAEAKPPTEAALRLGFPAAARAALAAGQPDSAGKPFGERLWQRAQGLITIREGDRVIVGDPAAGPLAQAQDRLDAGDLAGAVAAVSTLTGPAAQAMAGWLAEAKALLAAPTALDTMAAAS